MDSLIARVADFIARRGLLKAHQRIVVAVSGGVDSMSLLHLLNVLRAESCWEMIIAHFNHGLRGRESDRDERFVQRTAKAMGLSCEIGAGDIRKRREASRDSMEMSCRNARHEFFAKVARKVDAGSVALAHHASDQAELFVMRLLRGAGGDGLAGMSEKDPSPVDTGLVLVRPLLEISGDELREFAERNQIAFREDASNRSREHLRNRVRHEALPLLEKIFERNVERGALQSMRIIGDETACVEAATRAWLKAGRRAKFENLHPAMQRQRLRLQLLEHGIEPQFEWIEILREKRESWLSINPSLEISRDETGELRTRRTSKSVFEEALRTLSLKSVRGSVEFAGGVIRWRRSKSLSCTPSGTSQTGREVFDADRVGKNVTLRHWRPGDRFRPIGMAVDVKLQDWFTNLKIPREERRKLRLAVAESGHIFWIEGCRIGDGFRVTSETQRRLIWEWDPVGEGSP